jgi:hypothetical protein
MSNLSLLIADLLGNRSSAVVEPVKADIDNLVGALQDLSAADASNAAQQSGAAAIAGPTSTAAFTMAGLGVAFTPAKTGTVLVSLSGYFVTGTGTLTWGIAVQLSHGTGAAPVAGAALTGTQDGSVVQHSNSSAVTAAAVAVPFSIVCAISGLVIGTPIWIDVAQKGLTGTASGFQMKNVSAAAVEV